MGHSITDFDGRAFGCNDAGIEVWLSLLAAEIANSSDAPSWAIDAARYWHAQATAGCNGCVSADLDRICDSPEKAAFVVRASHRVLDWLRSQGPTLSKELLNSLGTGGPGSTFTGDLETGYFVRVGNAFANIITGELTARSDNLLWISVK